MGLVQKGQSSGPERTDTQSQSYLCYLMGLNKELGVNLPTLETLVFIDVSRQYILLVVKSVEM